jgi:ABC-type polysaccharide transport system permease subunit
VINEWKLYEDFQAFMKRPELAEALRNTAVMEVPHTIILDFNDDGSLN